MVGGLRGAMETIVGNKHWDTISNPGEDCISHRANNPWESFESYYSPSSYWEIVRQTGLFSLGMATVLEEGKL